MALRSPSSAIARIVRRAVCPTDGWEVRKHSSMVGSGKTKSAPTKEAYVPTPDELAALAAHAAGKKTRKRVPNFKVSKIDGKTSVSLDHPSNLVASVLLMDALGITDDNFLHGFLDQLASVVSPGRDLSAGDLDFVLSVVKGIEPTSQPELLSHR